MTLHVMCFYEALYPGLYSEVHHDAQVTGEVVRMIQADSDVVNCVQPHPMLPVVATSGIESVVRLWAPGDPDPDTDDLLKVTFAIFT